MPKKAPYSPDQREVLSMLRGKEKVALMAAPAFAVDFDYKRFVPQMKGMGFDVVSELTFGAKIVNQLYHRYIKEHYTDNVRPRRKGKAPASRKKGANFQERFISSVCPASVELIRNRYPELKKFLLPFDSPMAAMAKIIRKNYPSHKIVFLAPCPAKKAEARTMSPRIIDASVTFAEMKGIVNGERPRMKRGPHLFDSFYNDYTKVYPLAGGLSETLHSKDILLEKEMVACDGCTDIVRLFSSHPDKVFYDMLFCDGGCIGGPGVSSKMPLYLRKKSITGYMKVAKRESMRGAQGLDRYTEGLDFSRKF